MNPAELKSTLSSGLLSFPVTDFDEEGAFRPDSYAARLEWLMPYGASALMPTSERRTLEVEGRAAKRPRIAG